LVKYNKIIMFVIQRITLWKSSQKKCLNLQFWI